MVVVVVVVVVVAFSGGGDGGGHFMIYSHPHAFYEQSGFLVQIFLFHREKCGIQRDFEVFQEIGEILLLFSWRCFGDDVELAIVVD